MIHVPDVKATAEWYVSIGFEIRNVNRECDDGEIDWALLRLGTKRHHAERRADGPAPPRGGNLTFTPTSTMWTGCEIGSKEKPKSSKTCMTRFMACANSSFAIATGSGSPSDSRSKRNDQKASSSCTSCYGYGERLSGDLSRCVRWMFPRLFASLDQAPTRCFPDPPNQNQVRIDRLRIRSYDNRPWNSSAGR